MHVAYTGRDKFKVPMSLLLPRQERWRQCLGGVDRYLLNQPEELHLGNISQENLRDSLNLNEILNLQTREFFTVTIYFYYIFNYIFTLP